MGSQDTEITLGTGKMLALFFGLVALCGLFFGLGFSLGRGSVRPMAASDAAQTTTGPALRPSAMKSGGAPNQNSGDMRPFTQRAPTASLPPLPSRLLPGGANQFPGGSCTR